MFEVCEWHLHLGCTTCMTLHWFQLRSQFDKTHCGYLHCLLDFKSKSSSRLKVPHKSLLNREKEFSSGAEHSTQKKKKKVFAFFPRQILYENGLNPKFSGHLFCIFCRQFHVQTSDLKLWSLTFEKSWKCCFCPVSSKF